MAMTRRGGLTIAAVVGVAAFFGLRYAAQSGLIPGKVLGVSIVPQQVSLPTATDAPVNPQASFVSLNFPGTAPANLSAPAINYEIWAWNAQAGKLLAHGGASTQTRGVFQPAEGSLLAQAGVNVHFKRQDDPTKMQEDLLAFAHALHGGNPNPTAGTHFVAIMGDGAAAFLQGINPLLQEKYGKDYIAKAIGSAGYSYGEDKFMGPAIWKQHPDSARGGVIAGYLRDGDWNIALLWCSLNRIPNNPDETTYDPNALNWVSASDYIDAAQKYITGYTEERPAVINGRKTGKTKRISVQASVTWTPGDVNIAKNKGGLVSILSTRENKYQMPNTIIGIDYWMKRNRPTVKKMLKAFFDGGAMIKSSDSALERASAISAVVYNERDARYWKRYFNGVVEADVQGIEVELGGSRVNDLIDNLHLFGMLPNSMNLFRATYETFGNTVVEQYPKLVPAYPSINEAVDLSYLAELQNEMGEDATNYSDLPKYSPTAPVKETVATGDWSIEFALGSEALTATGMNTVRELSQKIALSDLRVIIHGHTDDQGDADANLLLSRRRALAVKNSLEKMSSSSFPEHRLRTVPHGEDDVLQQRNGESSAQWQQRCRRVVVQFVK